MSITKVTIKKDLQRGWYLISDSDGETFDDEWGNIRYWSKASSATAFLRRETTKAGNRFGWLVTNNVTGRISEVGNKEWFLDASKFGPHDWRKKNLVTISDKTGMYDIMRCELCSKEHKRYGLSSVSGGVCEKKPA